MDSSKSRGHLQEHQIGLGLSLVIHALFFVLILRPSTHNLPKTTVIDVSFEPPSAPKQQIVSPPAERSEKPPEATNKLSDFDSTAIKEQVKRGTDGGSPGAPSEPPPKPAPESNKAVEPPQKSTAKAPVKEPPPKEPAPPKPPRQGEVHLKDLKLDDATLAMRFGATSKTQPSSKSSDSASTDLSKYEAFSRPPGSGAAFFGSAGISDHLPNLPDGDITLLNAKANTYAGFVRRVAIQVFTQLKTQGWERLNIREVKQIEGFSTIEAVLSPEGRFITLNLLESSGSSSFDSVVKQSVAAGARDPNPPAGAKAADGNIHFIFKARSWASVGINRRSGAPAEHRWLLLATGLE